MGFVQNHHFIFGQEVIEEQEMSNQSILREKIKCIEVEEKSISNLIMEMGNTAFQGRTLSRAVDVWEEMLKADNLTIALGFSGSMCTAGQWKMICWLNMVVLASLPRRSSGGASACRSILIHPSR